MNQLWSVWQPLTRSFSFSFKWFYHSFPSSVHHWSLRIHKTPTQLFLSRLHPSHAFPLTPTLLWQDCLHIPPTSIGREQADGATAQKVTDYQSSQCGRSLLLSVSPQRLCLFTVAAELCKQDGRSQRRHADDLSGICARYQPGSTPISLVTTPTPPPKLALQPHSDAGDTQPQIDCSWSYSSLQLYLPSIICVKPTNQKQVATVCFLKKI